MTRSAVSETNEAVSDQGVPNSFIASYKDYQRYPQCIIDRAKYGDALLEEYDGRLRERSEVLNLFVEDSDVYIPYREVRKDRQVIEEVLWSNADVSSYLTDPSNLKSAPEPTGDPLFRTISLITAGSTRPLETTRESLKRILAYFQVMPEFLEFLYIFGRRDGLDSELRSSGFRTDVALSELNPAHAIRSLNRSGRRYQMCYSLKSVGINKDLDEKAHGHGQWKIRNAAFHHQFDVGTGTQLWILGDQKMKLHTLAGTQLTKERRYPERFSTFQKAFKTSLDTHLLYCRSACQDWRWFICSMEDKVQDLTIHCLLPPRPSGDNSIFWDPEGVRILQQKEERVNTTIMALKSNAEIITRLVKFFRSLVKNPGFPKREGSEQSVFDFTSRLEELIYDLETQTSRAQVLSKLVTDRKNMLIQHLQIQTVAQQERVSQAMWQQAESSGLEAIAVRVIAVITLIFLPATFVSTFFSTDVIKYQPDDEVKSGGPPQQYSSLALEMFFAVSIPMMVITFGLALAWYCFERRQKRTKYRRMQLYGRDLEDTYSESACLQLPWKYWKRGRIPSKSL